MNKILGALMTMQIAYGADPNALALHELGLSLEANQPFDSVISGKYTSGTLEFDEIVSLDGAGLLNEFIPNLSTVPSEDAD